MVDNQIDFSLAKVILFSFETDLTKEQYCHCNYNNNFHLKCTGPTVMSFGKKVLEVCIIYTYIPPCSSLLQLKHVQSINQCPTLRSQLSNAMTGVQILSD